jgi:Domain of unknown function (DUF4129)
MSVNRSNEVARTCGWVLLSVAGIAAFAVRPGRADETARPEARQFERADADTIRMYTRQILSEPDLVPRKTFWQWLQEKFSRWEKPNWHVGSRWATLIWRIFVIWAVLTLLAILIHAVWTIRLLIWPSAVRSHAPSAPGSGPAKITSFDELYKTAQAMAARGAFCEAISMMTIALLHLLDSIGIVRFHESKTNGDYVGEYPSGLTSRNEFRKFILIFEQTVYGRFPCDRQTYRQMNSLMEQIRIGVRQKA